MTHAGRIAAAGAVLAAVGLLFASRLSIDSDFAKLIPPDYESVHALDRLRDTAGGESEAAVVIEVRAITDDVRGSFGAGAFSVIFIATLYFAYKSYQARAGRRFWARILAAELARAPVTATVIGLPLIAALCWTFGTAYVAYGTLNLMTSTLGLVLLGLGIDYGIHFFGRYAEERGAGCSVSDAIQSTFATTGKAVMVTALTTAAAFFVLMAADFRGFSGFGFIAGVGILYALMAMVVLLPALLVLFERWRILDLRRIPGLTIVSGDRRSGGLPGARGMLVAGAAWTQETVALAALPEFVRTPFTARDGSVGRLVVIYPAVGLSDGRQSMAFADDVAEIRTDDGSVYHAGSTSLVAADMLRLMRSEAPQMIVLTLLMVVGVKLLLLRSTRRRSSASED